MELTFALRYSPEPLRPAVAWLLPGDDPRAWLAALGAWGEPQESLTLLRLARGDGAGGPAGCLVIPAGAAPAAGPTRGVSVGNVPPRRSGQWGGSSTSLRGTPRRDVPYSDVARVEPASEHAGPLGAAAFGRLTERLFLPVDARLEPEPTPAELQALVADSDALFVWHPALGLLAFAPHDILRVADLLRPPPSDGDSAWNCALPGLAVNQRLQSIGWDQPLRADDLLAGAAGDIGSQAGDRQGLPPRRDEATPMQSAMRQAGAQLGHAVAQAAGMLAAGVAGTAAALGSLLGGLGGGAGGGAPGGGDSRGRASAQGAAAPGLSWLEALQQWAQRLEQRWADQLDHQRNREVRRLLDLLEKRPDEGLKFALPLAGGEGARGLGAPGSALTQRDIDFSLRGIGSSGAADPWNVNENYRRQLEQRYRELANRELTLGRHRRAAYILAQLLGDFASAAKALEQGRHFREAAVLYRERLHAPRDAARCLRQGGLFAEAVAIYEELGDYEQAGDLYTELEEADQATAAYRRAIEARRAADDRLAAARLWEEKLRDLDGAYAELRAGWPCSQQASGCLEQVFALLGRRGRHEETGRLVAELPGSLPDAASRATLTERLAQLAVNYPDAEVRHAALDGARVLVAGDLQRATPDHRRRLMDLMRGLVPGDKLLARDCRQYLNLRNQAIAQVMKRLPQPRSLEAPLLRTISIVVDAVPEEVCAMTAHGDCFYALVRMEASQHQVLRLVRGRWDGRQQSILFAPQGVTSDTRWMLALSADRSTLRVEPTTQVACPETMFPPSGALGDPLMCESFSPGQSVWAIASAAGVDLAMSFDAQGMAAVLHTYAADGSLFGTRTIPWPEDDELDVRPPLPLVRLRDVDVLGLGRWLTFADELGNHHVDLTHRITGLAVHSPRGRPPRLAAMRTVGGVLFWGVRPDDEREDFAHDLADGCVGFTPGGWLVAANSSQMHVYHVDDKLRHLVTAPGPGEEVVGVLATDQPNQIALCTIRGRICIHQLPQPRR